MMKFRKARAGPELSRDAGIRQGRAASAAFTAFGTDGARSFLNAHHHGLGGRPLDLAVASDAGLSSVEAAICIEARRAADSC